MTEGPAERAVGLIAWLAIAGGLVLLIVAGLWWGMFYGDIVAQNPQGTLTSALPCLYSRKSPCGFIAAVARMEGRMAYSPTLFWLGASSFLAGAAGRLWLRRAS